MNTYIYTSIQKYADMYLYVSRQACVFDWQLSNTSEYLRFFLLRSLNFTVFKYISIVTPQHESQSDMKKATLFHIYEYSILQQQQKETKTKSKHNITRPVLLCTFQFSLFEIQIFVISKLSLLTKSRFHLSNVIANVYFHIVRYSLSKPLFNKSVFFLVNTYHTLTNILKYQSANKYLQHATTGVGPIKSS